MGKDQDLLDAARTGKLPLIGKLLQPKLKTSSKFAASIGFKVVPNVNCQDTSGYTPLHHASLNGHREVVLYLLENSASTNIWDVKGSCPLHLAAWSGHHHIVHSLLTYGPSVAKVNVQNHDEESPLHCASQHGHDEAVKILLRNGSDPTIRNLRKESALDLASHY